MTEVFVGGVGVVEFGRHEDTSLVDLGHQAATRALVDAGVDYGAVGEVFATSALAPPQTGIEVALSLGRTGVPVTAIESASAGGLVALRHAADAVRSGRCEVALAVGYEKTTSLEPGGVVPRPRRFWDGCPPQVHYAIEAARWLFDHGCGPEVFAAVAAKDWNAAALNPMAARRPDHEVSVGEVLESRLVASPLTRMMCHAAADGAAAVVVTSSPGPGAVRLAAIEQGSAIEDPSWPVTGPVVGPPGLVAMLADRAYERAGVAPDDVDVVSLHDMCASEELTTLVSLGLADAGDVIEMALAGELGIDGRLPTNVDGGCVARGHPISATGLAQASEIVTQLRGGAGDRQVSRYDTGIVQAAGGGGSAVVALLQRRER